MAGIRAGQALLFALLLLPGCAAETPERGDGGSGRESGSATADLRPRLEASGPDGPSDPCAVAVQLDIVAAQDEGQAEEGHGIEQALDGLGASDGDPESRWARQPLPTSVTFDLGSTKLLCSARLSFYLFDQGRSYRYRLQRSLDGTTWTEVTPPSDSAAAEWTVVPLAGQPARFVRLHLLSATPETEWAGLWEVELWGAAAAAGPDGSRPVDAGTDSVAQPDLPAGQVILQIDFDDHPAGEYTGGLIDADWGDVQWSSTGNPSRTQLVEGAEAFSGRSLRVFYPAGGVGPGEGGAQWRVNLPGSYDELEVSYRVKFVADVDFRLGGKLPGLCGGACYTGGENGLDGWSARIMWRQGGDVVQYVYWPGNASWGDDLRWDVGGQRSFLPGQWHQVRTRIVINTAGQANGGLQSWFDGQLALDRHDRIWRVPAYPDIAIDQFYFSTFYGGSGDEWAPEHDVYAYFDDFVFVRP